MNNSAVLLAAVCALSAPTGGGASEKVEQQCAVRMEDVPNIHASDCPNGGTHTICAEDNGRQPFIPDLFMCECAERCLADEACTVMQYQESREQGRKGSQCFLYNSCEHTREYASDTWCFKIARVLGHTDAPACSGAAQAGGAGVALDLDAACVNAKGRPDAAWASTVGDFSLDTDGLVFEADGPGSYHFDHQVKLVKGFDISPSAFPALTIEIWVKVNSPLDENGWIIGHAPGRARNCHSATPALFDSNKSRVPMHA